MAEAMTVGILCGNLTPILVQERIFHEFRRFKYAIRRMNPFFKPKPKPYSQYILDEYILDEIEDLIVDTEDSIDSHIFNLFQKRGVTRIFALVQLKLFRFDGLLEIVRIRRRKFEELYNRFIDLSQVDVEEDGDGRENSESRGGGDSRSSYAVEFPAEENTLIKKLISGGPELSVVSIVGMSASARSTLAGKVFYDPVVVSHFVLLARVWISPLHTRRDCLEAIVNSVVEPADEMKQMSEEDLSSDLKRYLTSARYLIVFDGRCNFELWKYLFDFLPANMFGSRIILTDESVEVSRFVNFTCPLQPLSIDESRNLLLGKVFGGGECPSELKQISHKIAERCMGLPIATVLISGVLQWRRTLLWWQSVDSSLSEIHVDDESEIFGLIYSYLPHHLKQCFLYIGHFPEECEIRARQLITLWIAEGFVVIPENKQRLMEEVAEEYLEDLISWNLIQPAQRKFDGGVKSLRIHDFLRVLCMSKAREVKDLEVRVYDESSPQCKSRRISIHHSTLRFMSSYPYAPKLRSLLCFGRAGERVSPKHWKSVYKGYFLLRVLELWGVVVDNIPSQIEKLIYLRYLRLKSDSATVLPLSIYNLGNLQTLEVVAPLIKRPQVNIWKLRKLRHFYFNGEAVLLNPPNKMDETEDHYSSDLQTLSTISPDSCRKSVLSKVPNLVKLGIYGDLETHREVAFENLFGLNLLKKLKLVRDRQYRRLATIPNWVKFPPMLVKLTLLQTELSVDPMAQLAQLPNLQVLKLIDSAYEGEVLNCISCEFHKLKVLKLVNLGIKSWSISIKSMPSLQNLVIDGCASLVALPSLLKEMSTLSELQLQWPNLSVVKCAKEIATYKEEKKEHLKLMIYHAEDSDDTD